MRARWIHKIEPSSYCNFKCPYCPNTYGLDYGHGNMRMETFERICYWTEILNPSGQPPNEPFIHLHGIGEPLLNKNIVEFVRMMSKIKPCGFSTNGQLLTHEMIDALEDAGIGYLCVSTHDPEIAMAAVERMLSKERSFLVLTQEIFNDDFAGQIDEGCVPHKDKTTFHCAHIETGGVHVLWNGMIVNCCVDARGDPILGSVFDDEIRGINIDVIPLCKDCRNAKFLVADKLRQYSNTLTVSQKEELFWRDVRRIRQ